MKLTVIHKTGPVKSTEIVNAEREPKSKLWRASRADGFTAQHDTPEELADALGTRS